jgi:hypothetical protein
MERMVTAEDNSVKSAGCKGYIKNFDLRGNFILGREAAGRAPTTESTKSRPPLLNYP